MTMISSFKKVATAFATICLASIGVDGLQAANIWWVDDEWYGKGGDGSEARPFGTIVDATTNAAVSAGDTIKVMPGTYDKGLHEEDTVKDNVNIKLRSRVYLNRKLYIVAVGSKEETHIVGRLCPESEGGDPVYKTGPSAVRGIRVGGSAEGSTLTGFTIRDCAASINKTGTSAYWSGSAVTTASALKRFYVIDCVISNSYTYGVGAASYGGTFIQCLISGCRSYDSGAATCNSAVLNSVITGCASGKNHNLVSGNGSSLINCTVYGNASAKITAENCFNCIFAGNRSVVSKGAELNVETNLSNRAANIYASEDREYANADAALLFAPALGDFHPLPGSAVLMAGESKWLGGDCPVTLPKDLVLRDMDGEVIDLSDGTIAAGAYQKVKTPRFGGVLLTDDAVVNGSPTYGTNLLFAASWPMQVKVETDCYALKVAAPKASEIYMRYPGKDGYVMLTAHCEAGVVQTNALLSVGASRYVDANNGSDGNSGSKDSPYATIQKAVDSMTSTGTRYVVYVAEGDYTSGGGSEAADGVTNRVDIDSFRYIKFVATGDSDKTIIRGAAAKNERDAANYPGCGPDAVRCVNYSISGNYDHSCAFVGFTFADGHTDVGQDDVADKGGAVFGRNSKYDALQFVDCTFTNCYAPAAGIGYMAHFTRCRFVDCGSATDGFQTSILSSCVVGKGSFGTGVLGSKTYAVGSSIADNAFAGGEDQYAINSALGAGGILPASVTSWGSTVDPCFADGAKGDFRPVSGSPALDASRRDFPVAGDGDWTDFTKYFSDMAVDGIDGSAWLFGGAYPVAGVCMDWANGVSVLLDKDAYTVTGGAVGGNVLAPGESISIARSADAVRHYGIVVNGVTNMLDGGAYVYTAGDTADMYSGTIVGVIDPNWYVNADESKGDDANDGFTAATPKLSLKGVLSVATNAGDVVHAAAGVYARETMVWNDTYGDARAIVKPHVTLVGDEGADKTFISGAFCETSTGTYLQGEGAMRCVMLHPEATVKGFTLTNGHSRITGTSDSATARFNGGGAWANKQHYTARVIDCVISNCAAPSGGAAFGVALFGCKVSGNRSNYSATTLCSLYGCVVGSNSHNSASVYRAYDVYDTTVSAPGKSKADSVALYKDTRMCNSLVLWNCTGAEWSEAPRNSVFCGTYSNVLDTAAVDCVLGADVSVDGDFRPAARSSACDIADDSLLPGNEVNAKMLKAIRAKRGISNGRMDVGCLEADWREFYAGDIARNRITVESATSNVVETAEGAVRINPGQEVSALWIRDVGSDICYQFNFQVVGSGELTVSANGRTYAYRQGVHKLRLREALAEKSLTFAYSGDDGCAEMLAGCRSLGACISIR